MTKSLYLACALSALTLNAFSQTATELPKHPGDVLKFEVKFSGPDASKVKQVKVAFYLKGGTPPANQSGFMANFGGVQVPSITPNTFQPQATIPDQIASGDYTLEVDAITDGIGSAGYADGRDFHLHMIHIDNPKTFTPPSITVTERP